MNKKELIEAIAKEAGVTKAEAERNLNAFITVLKKALKTNKKVTVVGFGTFSAQNRKATTGRNPRTGQAIKIPASKQAKFKAGKALKDAINAA